MSIKTDTNYENVKGAVQFELLNKLKTGNVILDAIISMMIFSSVAYATSCIPKIFGIIMIFTNKFTYYMKSLYRKIFHKKNDIIYKQVIIEHITDTKQVNELFEAVKYYMANNELIDYVKETPLKLTYENRIEKGMTSNETPINNINNIKLNKFIVQNKTKKFIYKEHEIKYCICKDIITIYTDKERKKENYIITLSTDIKSDSKIDILNDFCEYCLGEYIKSVSGKKWEQRIFVNNKGLWESQLSNNKRKIDTIILRNGNKQEIMDDLKLFLHSEDWYNERDIPYTRGYLFYGKPGTGKTSFIKGISNYCKRHIHFLILKDIKDDNELLGLLKQINYKETILVIEDIDCMSDIIKDRQHNNTDENTQRQIMELTKKINGVIQNNHNFTQELPVRNSQLTLSGLLNAIDGVFNNDGRILIMTTNHPEVLDKALIRPGRIDQKILFDNCDKKQITELYKMFFNRDCDVSQLQHINDCGMSPAYITGLFLQYRDKPNEVLNHLRKEDDHPTIKPLFEKTNICDIPNTQLVKN